MNNGEESESPEEDWSVAVQVAYCESFCKHHSDSLWGECLSDCLLEGITTFIEMLFHKIFRRQHWSSAYFP